MDSRMKMLAEPGGGYNGTMVQALLNPPRRRGTGLEAKALITGWIGLGLEPRFGLWPVKPCLFLTEAGFGAGGQAGDILVMFGDDQGGDRDGSETYVGGGCVTRCVEEVDQHRHGRRG